MTDAAVPVGTPPRPTAAPSSTGEVCDHLGITAHTARYYERIGLIEVGRSPSGHRVFDQRAVDRLDFLVRMRSSGMGISELTRYVDLVNQGESTIPERLQIMRNQRQRIIDQIHDLERALTATEYKIAVYGGAPDDTSHSPKGHHP